MTEPNFMHQPPTQKFLPLFSRTSVFNPFRTSPHHAWHPVPLPLQDKATALWSSNALELPVPGDFPEHILWTCLTTWDTLKLPKASIDPLPKTIRWNNLGEYQHQYQKPIFRCYPSSSMLVNLLSAVQLLAHRLLDLPHQNQPFLLQQEKPTDSRFSAPWDRWDRALFMQTGPTFRIIEESQRSPRTSSRTLPYRVEAPTWTLFKCRLHHGTCSSPFSWYQCKQVAGLASTKILYCFQPEPESLLLPCYSQAKDLYASVDHIPWPSNPWNQLTPVDLVSSSFCIAFNCRPNCGVVKLPAPESLLLPWCPQGKGLFASKCKGRSPVSSPACFGFSRRLKNWSPASTNSQLSVLSQGNRNTLSSQHPLTTILPKHPPQHPPPPNSDIKNA